MKMRTGFVLVVVCLAWTVCGCAAPVDRDGVGYAHSVPEWEDTFKNVYRDGRVYFTGVPSPEGLARSRAVGVTTVIDLVTDGEREEKIGYDHVGAIRDAGLEYVRIPMTPKSFSAADVDAFARVLGETRGKVVVHCSSANRAGAVWAAYLYRERGFEKDEAMARGRAAGMWKLQAVEMAERVMGEGVSK